MKYLLRVAAAAAIFAAATGGAAADDYPSRLIRIIVPFQPGGAVNIIARLFGDALHSAWGKPVIVDPKPGAGGVLASQLLVQSAPDGYTLMMATANVAIDASLYKDISFDTEKDLVTIAQVVAIPSVIVVKKDLPVKTFGDLIDLAHKKPGKLNYSSGGNGSLPHLVVELLKAKTSMDIVHIPYKGNAPALLALLGGDVDLMDSNIPDVMPYINDGRFRPLAVTGSTRSASLPDVPTVDEIAVPGFKTVGWLGFFAPRGTPNEIVQKLSAQIGAALKTPIIADFLARQGFEVLYSTPEQFAKTLHEDIEYYALAVKVSGAVPE
jgi:tripartite-type tricarboxylate transporter receptor subunit TctC